MQCSETTNNKSHIGKKILKCKILSSGIHLAGIQCSIVVHDVENRRHHVFLSGKLSFSIPNCSPVFHQCTVEGISTTFCKCETPWNLRFLKPHTNIRLGFFHSGSWEGGDLLCDELRVRAHLASFHHQQMFLYPTASVSATPSHGNMKILPDLLFPTKCTVLYSTYLIKAESTSCLYVCYTHQRLISRLNALLDKHDLMLLPILLMI